MNPVVQDSRLRGNDGVGGGPKLQAERQTTARSVCRKPNRLIPLLNRGRFPRALLSGVYLMRVLLLSALALSVSTPALAASPAQRDMERTAARLSDPATQDAMAGAFGGLLGALLDMRVDGIAKALEPMNGGKPNRMKGRTIREIAMRDDPQFERKAENGARAMVGGMGAMAAALAQAMPQLEEAMAKAEDAMDRVHARDELRD